jgi:hypothetical protein
MRSGARASSVYLDIMGISVNVNAQPWITNVTNSVVNVVGNPATNPLAPGGEYIGGTLYNWTH